MTPLDRLVAMQRIREERVQELIALLRPLVAPSAPIGKEPGAVAVRASLVGIVESDHELRLIARAVQPSDTTDDADAVLSLALVAAVSNLVAASETVVAEGKLPPVLHQLLKTHAKRVGGLLDNRKRRQLVAAAERVDASAEVQT